MSPLPATLQQLDLFSHRQSRSCKMRRKNAVPCEWKIVAVRECASPAVTTSLDHPLPAVHYWQSHVVSAPHFNPDVECFVVILLTTKHHVRGHHLVSIGSLNETMAHPREVFRAAVIGAAYSVVLMHNHPSGDPSPSEADRRITRKHVESGNILQIGVTDHIIIGKDRHFSFREAGLI